MRLLNNPARVTTVIGMQDRQVFCMSKIENTHDVNWISKPIQDSPD